MLTQCTCTTCACTSRTITCTVCNNKIDIEHANTREFTSEKRIPQNTHVHVHVQCKYMYMYMYLLEIDLFIMTSPNSMSNKGMHNVLSPRINEYR